LLLRLIEDRTRRERYGMEGRKLAAARFGIDGVVARILELYADLLGGRGAVPAPNASAP
jgi:hypothetical protein